MFVHKVFEVALKWSRAQEVADYFGQVAFLRVVVLVSVPAWLWLGHSVQTGQLDAFSGNLFLGILLVVGWLICRLCRAHYIWAICLFLAAQLAFTSYVLWHMHDLTMGYLFILSIGMAGSLLGPIGAYATAGGAAIIGLGMVSAAPGTIGTSTALTRLIFLELLAAVISGQASLGLYNALDSAEISAREAREHAEEARRHRGKLQRTLKALDLAYSQLEKANSELFYARQAADAALRFKSRFAAQVSHELRTSLNLILGFSETMAFSQNAYGARLPTAYLRDVMEIYRNSRHLLTLVDDILDLSKLEAGRMGLHREPVDVGAVLCEATDVVRPLVEAKGLELTLDLPPALPVLLLDRSRIGQVLLNLLNNAVRVTSHGRIVVKAVLCESELIVQVSDTGAGISPENLERLFEEFYQAGDNAGLTGSAGLGLAVSKRIVQLHGGRMWVESTLGVGSVFSFAFPLQKNVASLTASTSVSPHRLPQPVVVVMGRKESEEVKLLQRHLEGYTLVVACTWEEVTHLAAQFSARAVVVNAPVDKIPDPTSFPLPILACPLPGVQQMEQTMGVACYLQKPVTVKAIQAALHRTAPAARSLLIVDDDSSAVRLIERMVQGGGRSYRIFRAYSGREALGRVRAQRPDAILLDLVMPEGDGFWLISALRRDPDAAHIPIVVISGRAVEETWQSGAIGIVRDEGFKPTETLGYLQALLSATPPAPVERCTIVPPLSTSHPG